MFFLMQYVFFIFFKVVMDVVEQNLNYSILNFRFS